MANLLKFYKNYKNKKLKILKIFKHCFLKNFFIELFLKLIFQDKHL